MTKKLVPINEIRILTKRKKEYLGLPTQSMTYLSGGRDGMREMVRIRDKHTCQICKRVRQENERRFDVHHRDLDSKKTRQVDSLAEFPNLITLCHKCHLRLHHGLAALPNLTFPYAVV